jgi:[acyl-carrier-protein] S-malonyltransferase
MVNIAYIFPGQGAQYVGMGKDLYENFSQAREVFDRANQVLKFDLKRLAFEGPQEELSKTENCQVAILAASIAALRVLEVESQCLPDGKVLVSSDYVPQYSLGLSLGEYTALVACGCVSFDDALLLVRKRGELMEDAARKNPGKMACIIGMETKTVEELCKGFGCEIANLNCPGQVVISGKTSNVELFASIAREKGAKRVVMLDVSGPFHSSLMTGARDKLKEHIEKVQVLPPKIAFVSNVDAKIQSDPYAIKENLIRQVNSRTLWEQSIRTVAAGGVKTFFEIGPGAVLKGLLKKIDPSLDVRSVGTCEDVQAFQLSQS